jgi:hypothetical protein
VSERVQLFSAAKRRTVDQRRVMMVRRMLATALILMLSAAACGSPIGSQSPQPSTPSATNAVSIPTGNLSAFDRCLIAAGYQIKAFNPDSQGRSQYQWTLEKTGADADRAREEQEQCKTLSPSPHILTDAEVADVYNLWVDEYHCLVGMGYEPTSPPSVEAFIASWKTSVWMPIDGIDTDHWTQTQYDQAKAKCTLEFFTAEGLPQ